MPIAIKSNVPVAGLCMNFASKFLAGHRPSHNAYLVRRLRDAGFVVIGTTNMPEFGILPTTEPRHTGVTHNPWDLERTPGGSSGGSAAAVAAGMIPVAHGNDGGGSLRIPAACCGLVGLKPSRGRVSRGPDLGDSFLACDGVLTRTVAETAQLLDVLAGYEVGDATWAPRPIEPYATSVRRDPGRLRVAMTADNPLGIDVDPECVRGMHVAGELLSSLGHEVEHASPALPGGDVLGLFIQVFGPQVSLGIRYGELLAGREPEDDEIEPLSRAIFDLARSMTSVDYLGALAQLQAIARGHRGVLRRVRPAAHAGARRAPAARSASAPATATIRWPTSRAPAASRRSRRCSTSPASRRSACRSASATTACRPRPSIVAKPLGEDTLLQVAAQMEAALGRPQQIPDL